MRQGGGVGTTQLQAAERAVVAAFLALGLASATWFVRIPDLRDRAGLGEGTLGLVLAAGGVGAVLATLVCGRLVATHGSAPAMRVALPAVAGALALASLASSAGTLLAAGALLGIAFGTQDVAMNAHGVTVEHERGRPLLSRLHAMFSLGALAGGGLGALVISAGIGPTPHLLGVAALLLLALPAYAGLLPASVDAEGVPPEAPSLGERLAALRHPWLVACAVVALASFIAENSVGEWSGVFLRDERGAADAVAALGYVALNVAMVVGRLVGDRLVTAVGERRTLLVGGTVATLGWLAVVVVDSAWVAIGAWAVVGLAVANVIPVVFRAAGARGRVAPPGRALPASAVGLSIVTGLGYAGGLLGPGLIGGIAHATSLPTALLLPVVLSALIVVLGPVATRGLGRPAPGE